MVVKKPALRLDSKISSLPGVLQTRSRWKHGIAYVVAGKEFAHFHGPNEIDVRLTKAVQREIGQSLKDQRVKLRPRPSEWITISVRKEEDVAFALLMIKQAWRANGGHQAPKA
jgi:hypothetical protein